MRSPALIFLFLCICVNLRESLGMSMLDRLRAVSSKLFTGTRPKSSIFSSMASSMRTPACAFDRNNVPQFTWPSQEKLCYSTTPPYPFERVFNALKADTDAMEYMVLIDKCYMRKRMNYTGTYELYRYKDLCDSNLVLLERIWMTNYNGMREMCYIIMPEEQGIYVANCGKKNNTPLQKNCLMDNTAVRNHYCVPDGFVERDIYVFCPGQIKQCVRTKITIPTGCSCKKYECLKFAYV